jgi:hypothetical protein
VISIFFGLEGCTELVFLVLRLEFAGLLFSDEIFGIFNHSSNIRVFSDQMSFVIYTRPSLDLVSRAQRATFRRIRYPSITKLVFLLCQSRIAALYPPGPSLCLNLFFRISSFILLLCAMDSGVVCGSLKVLHSFGVMNTNQLNGETPG